jgi:membrane protease YdiL (CAAX protease family)
MRSIFGINQSIPDATGRVSRGQFLRLGWWFTLALWLMAAMLSLLFGLLHATSIAHVILASVLGVLLGLFYQWSGSLWPPIAAHLGIDLVTGLLLARKSLT